MLKKQLLTLGAESAIYIVEYWGMTLALKWRPSILGHDSCT
jgi:hypothetical protein